MEVQIVIPADADLTVILTEYPDMSLDGEYARQKTFYLGEADDAEWLTRDQAIECCGFIVGAVPGADTLITGNGPWAQNLLRRKDFSGLAMADTDRVECEREAALWHAAYARGQAASEAVTWTDLICPKCGSGDIQLDGLQAIRVVEDWTDGERWNYEYPEKPSGQWLTLEAHCNVCAHEWAPPLPQSEDLLSTGEDLTHAGELLPCAGEEKPTEGVYRCLQIC